MNNTIQDAIIYLGSNNEVAAISGVNNPTTSFWIGNIAMTNSIGTVPGFQGPTTFELSNFQNLQTQPFNASAIMGFLAQGACCLAHTNTIGTQGLTVNNSNDGNWTYGSNPFGNSNSPIRIVDDIVFQTGTITTIENMVLEFDEDADMIIEKGARVNLNGSTLTSLSCTNIMWPGVDLLGTTNASSSIDQNPQTGGDQGYLYMNNSMIEDALMAVDIGTTAPNKGGGILRAFNSTFRNNYAGVIFRKYHYIIGNQVYVQNKSTFDNCIFTTTSALNLPGYVPYAHAQLTAVDKIRFKNCSFMNQTPITTHSWTQRGMGIYAFQSSFTVDGSNDAWTGSPVDLEHTTFYRLRYGIRSHGSNNPLAFYTCKEQEFQYCLYGIVNYNSDNTQIYLNNFVIPEAFGYGADETMERGIYLTNSTGYVVEQNTFNGHDDWTVNEPFPSGLGIWVDNSGDAANEIRNNDFNEMKLGTYISRNNTDYIASIDGPVDPDGELTDQNGLQLFCNTYTNGRTDIYRDSETILRWVQGGNQGPINPVTLTGNRFSADDCNGAISDFVCDPYNFQHIEYMCHDQPSCIPDCGGISNYPNYAGTELLTSNIDYLNAYDEVECPDNYGAPIIINPNPGFIPDIITQLHILESEIATAKNTYIQFVDDNQKQSTIDILTEAFPHESAYYRDLLMQRYPLSDDVLKQLVLAASRLSPWHLTEVFLANSPLSREVLYNINEAQILSVFFMTFLYDADHGTNLRKLMELNILGLTTKRDQLIQAIARAGLNYQTSDELETDYTIHAGEYLVELAKENGTTSKRIIASNLANQSHYVTAIDLLANEPLLASYATILQIQESVSNDWSLLSTDQIYLLWNIYRSTKDYSSSLALSILQQIGEADFEPEPRLPIQYRSLQIEKLEDEIVLPLLGVWPNPSNNEAWLHYPIEADGHSIIQIFDPQGKLVHSFQPNAKGLVPLDVKNYQNGIYIIQLIAFDQVVENIKFTVLHNQ